MIEQAPLPKDWDKHHTLYYRKWYLSKPLTKAWRESTAMIVPIDIPKHAELHANVFPEETLPGDALAGYALHICDELEKNTKVVSRFEAFNFVKDELHGLYKKRRRLDLGKEALEFVRFFDKQLEFMSEIPVPDGE